MNNIQGPAIFLAQFASDQAPFDTLENICQWAASLGYKGVQIPVNNDQFIDLERAATDLNYCDQIQSTVNQAGLEISELSTHLQGQLVAVHPAYDQMFDGFAPEACRGNPQARQEWAVNQLMLAAQASKNLNLSSHATFSGALLWPTVYPWPQRPNGLVESGFQELAKRWLPILDAFEEAGVDVCYELHPGEDLHDGASFEAFLQQVDHHPRACILYDPSHFLLQQLDYLAFIDIYHQRIKAFHVKDAEFNPTGRVGVYGGYQSWQKRAGRFRSLGDGQVDFKGIFSRLTQYGFEGWAVLEWECCIKDAIQGATEGATFIQQHMIQPARYAFDDFAAVGKDQALNHNILGLKP